ncbi:MAG TPA: alkaline phosphatase family protein, partial [Opitutales bacterium]|nr:alkaline phosphatase family protein [Opitutales bacterium]
WDWLAEHIQVPTLWNQAAEAGRTTAGVGWPVSVGASDIHYNIPERVIGSESPEVWSVVTPGLIKEIGTKARARIDAGEVEFAKADWERTSYALEIIDAKKPDLIGVHLAAADSMQHRHGPFSKETIAALEEIDMMVGILTDAFRATDPGAIVCAASDHGFTSVDRVLRIDAAFERAGLITFESRGKTYADSEIGDWVAKQLPAGGSSPVFLKDPDDVDARERVRKVLNELAADSANGIAAILEREQIAALGGNPDADFWIDLVSGFIASHHLDGSLVAPRRTSGTHGYSPSLSEMNSAFFITGEGIPAGLNLGSIDMRNIAPTLAKALGFGFPSADLPALDVFRALEETAGNEN